MRYELVALIRGVSDLQVSGRLRPTIEHGPKTVRSNGLAWPISRQGLAAASPAPAR